MIYQYQGGKSKPKMKEFNLSEKIVNPKGRTLFLGYVIYVKDVKEFIRIIQEDMYKNQTGGSMITIFTMENIIKKRAGDDLI